MGRPVARKKQHKGDKPLKEKYRMRRKTKDIDQIHEDLKRENAEKLLNQEVDLDKPGSAQFYCLHCAYVVTLSAPLLIKKRRSLVSLLRTMSALGRTAYPPDQSTMLCIIK